MVDRRKYPDTPADRARAAERNREHQQRSLATASRHRHEWTSADLDAVRDATVPLGELAVKLGRTYKAVSQMRNKLGVAPRV